jgi:predicted ATPase
MTIEEKLKSAISRLALYRGLNAGLSGGPSVGKTTQIDLLAAAGFPVLNEMALILLDDAAALCEQHGLKIPDAPGLADAELIRLFAQNNCVHPLVDNPAFQLRMLTHKQLVVWDRTYIEILGYCKLYNLEPPPGILDVTPAPGERLDVCYFLQPHGTFEANGRRVEKADEGAAIAEKLGPLLSDCYTDEGVHLVRVPSFKDLAKDDAIRAKQEFIWTDLAELAEKLLREIEG